MIAYTSYATENRARLEAEALVDMGFEVIFLVLKEGKTPRTYADDRGVIVQELNLGKYCGKSSVRYVLSYFAFLALALVACTYQFFAKGLSVVHVHNMPDFLVFAGLVPRLCGRPLILDIHDSMAETYLGKFNTNSRMLFQVLRIEEVICCWFATSVICVNHPQRDAVIEHGVPAEKIATILSIPKFTSRKSSSDDRDVAESFKLVYHGTISTRLGLDLAVEAVAKLSHVISDLEFHIYGSGDDLNEVLHHADVLGVADRVLFHGVVDWEKLPETLKAMDVGIVANRRNIATELMLPAKLMDYVSLGIPSVAPRLKAIEYYFSEDMVSLFRPENVDELAAAIFHLYSDKSRRIRQARMATRFLQQYRWENQKSRLRELYRAGLYDFVCSDEEVSIRKSPTDH
jgi:glycosyltransferase involved in cell wall biosynthesis